MGLQEERLSKIHALVDQSGFMSTNDIAKALQVSSMTIRRDLKKLENDGKLTRIYGGAQSNKQIEFSTNEKLKRNITEKKEIAQHLATLIPDNSTVYLGAGTTILLAVPYLSKKKATFVTNSLPAFTELINSDCRIFLTGGELHRNTEEFLGKKAESMFKGLNLDFAICSTNGINNNHVTTSMMSEGNIQNIAFDHAQTSVIVADHTKLNHSDIITFQDLSNFDFFVTDSGINDIDYKKYSHYVKIIH
ncbi:DeoR/GlpR family DNA-binding transcription regulator [Bombilactobacillus bombi]|uniref:DeoR/GlpR family DNA-binding transcription regulator n=1 Tax=Bombilactobacillus bombi TaxID=1303590 RepID=UPI0015E5FFA1|nr:DeoR/GlpR family DNA-binding transcription regulator [Bombilactobacillus bombi]MBA1434109.1 DeoR/GlpR transcriptional regulator [Bombilactobacillus bombi]